MEGPTHAWQPLQEQIHSVGMVEGQTPEQDRCQLALSLTWRGDCVLQNLACLARQLPAFGIV